MEETDIKEESKKNYKITLLIQGNVATFTCDDPSPTKDAWENNKKLCVNHPDGKMYFYDLSKYHTMIIEENKNE